MGSEKKRQVIPLPWMPPYNGDAQRSLMEFFNNTASESMWDPMGKETWDPESPYWYIETDLLTAIASRVIPKDICVLQSVAYAASQDDRFVPFEDGYYFFGKVDGKEVLFAAENALRKYGYILGDPGTFPLHNDPFGREAEAELLQGPDEGP